MNTHLDSPSCTAARVHSEYVARGYVQVNGTWAKILRDVGVPVESALARVVLEVSVGSDRAAPVLVEETFAPRGSVAAVQMLRNLPMSGDFRRAAVKHLMENPEDLAAMDAIARMTPRGDRLADQLAAVENGRDPRVTSALRHFLWGRVKRDDGA